MQTYQDAINALLEQSVILPSEVIARVENFIEENKDRSSPTKRTLSVTLYATALND